MLFSFCVLVCARVYVHVCARARVCACIMCIYHQYSFKLHGLISLCTYDVIESYGNAYTTRSVTGFRQRQVRVGLPTAACIKKSRRS
jgi:hypothetical protein